MIWKNKLRIPQMEEELCACPALCGIFDRQDEPFLIVSAMSGYGKTAVLSQEAARAQRRVYWYTLDMTDNQEESFFTCLEALWDEIEQDLQAGRAAAGGQADRDGRTRMAALLMRMDAWEESGRIPVVFDNVQVLGGTQVCGFVDMLLQYATAHIQPVLVTNGALPQCVLTRLLAHRGRLLGAEALALSPQEVIRWKKPSALPEELICAVTEQMCGWPLGVSYVLGELEERVRPLNWQELLTDTLLGAYLDRMFWQPCTEKQREFLMQTALLSSFSWESAAAILPENTREKTYAQLVSGGIFLRKNNNGTYSYGEMLRTYLCGMTGAAQKKEIYKKAAEYYLKKKQYADMAVYAVAGAQEEFVLGCMEQYGDELLLEEHRDALERLVLFLEASAARMTPPVCGVIAQYAYSRSNYDRMEFYFNAADSTFGKENKYGAYRGLYKALRHLADDKEKYGKQLNHALFFLRESGFALPYLNAADKEKLAAFLSGEQEEKDKKAVQVQSFGTFCVRIAADGRELAWRTRKGCELFAYLIDLKGAPVGRRQLLEALWQEEMPENAVAMLHNMIYNIRKELSDYRLEGMISYKNRKYSLAMDSVAWDFYRVEQLAELVEKHKDAELFAKADAFRSYWGRYLEDIDSRWAQEKQRYYDEIFKKGCRVLAAHCMEQKDYAKAQIYYENILSLEPYAEDVMAQLLETYGARKDWQRLRDSYQSFCALLKEDLGIAPGAELSVAYHRYL